MKNLPSTLLSLAMGVSLLRGIKVQAQNNNPPTGSSQIQSVFIMPTSSKEGRDPFFPESTRTIEAMAASTHMVEISSLRVPGISGTPGHLLAIINNHTFAVGDEGDVLTTSGRVSLRCLEIHPDYVIVEINGQIHRINMDDQ